MRVDFDQFLDSVPILVELLTVELDADVANLEDGSHFHDERLEVVEAEEDEPVLLVGDGGSDSLDRWGLSYSSHPSKLSRY